MKTLQYGLAICSAALLTACATRTVAPLPAVGPSPVAGASTTPGTGTLVVYSAWSPFNNLLTTDHSGYNIYSMDGKKVKFVPNAIEGDLTKEPPSRVALAPGRYEVKAEGGIYGWVSVPVVIKEGKTTPVYLDNEYHRINEMSANHNVVRLPDGEIVGFAAGPGNGSI